MTVQLAEQELPAGKMVPAVGVALQPLRKLKHMKERSVIWRLHIRLGHLMTKTYFPGLTYGEALAPWLVLMHVLLATCEGTKAPSVSDLSRIMGMSRPTILRRLGELIERGYVDRVGDRYVATEACDVDEHQVERQVREIELAAKALLLAQLSKS